MDNPVIPENLQFDQALQELEEIVARLESNTLTLEESMAAFERGAALNRFCAAKLGEAEKKIELLVRNARGELQWTETPQP